MLGLFQFSPLELVFESFSVTVLRFDVFISALRVQILKTKLTFL